MNLLNNKALAISLAFSLLIAGITGYKRTNNHYATPGTFETKLNNYRIIAGDTITGSGQALKRWFAAEQKAFTSELSAYGQANIFYVPDVDYSVIQVPQGYDVLPVNYWVEYPLHF
ncbi:MAG: hypothetical protein WCQ99_07665 [Pseudomonadota bacterium]